MEVDDESKKVVSEPVAVVDATKVTEERKEEEADVEGAEAMGIKRNRRGQEKEEEEVSLWADVGGEETL